MITLWSTAAYADAIAPGPPICPPGTQRVIQDHAEQCAFSLVHALIEGGLLIVVIGLALGLFFVLRTRPS